MENAWHAKSIADIFKSLGSGENGLDKEEIIRRAKEYGPNKLPEAKVEHLAVIFLRQFQSPLIYILLAASAIVFVMGEVVDSIIILAVLIFNAIVGTVQEGKAQNTLLALKKFVETGATVIRDNITLMVPDYEIVPGDIIMLQEGDKVPADARIIHSNNLKIDEAALTGESEPVHKIADILEREDLPTVEQKNMVFKSTNIVAGNGKAVVVATGVNTVIGKISQKIASIDTEIPLRANIRYLSRLILIGVAIVSVPIFAFGTMLGSSMETMFVLVISLAVSLIPEGLPIVVTLVLAAGVWRMSKRNALIKRLQAVEALGQARVILVDKTGTITKNEMVVQKVYVGKNIFEVSGIGYEPEGTVQLNGKTIDHLNHPDLLFLGKMAAFCADARIAFVEESKQWKAFGDPTEAALLVLAQKLGFHKDILEQESPQIAEIPFDYKTKYHATLHQLEKRKILTVAGAPENILDLSDAIWEYKDSDARTVAERRRLTAKDKKELEDVLISMSWEGLRVLGIAVSYDTPESMTAEAIKDLTFVGFVAMKDALRPEVFEALERARSADVRVAMITGDNKITAQAIAKEAGIWAEGDIILTGKEIEALSDEELSQKLGSVTVFARVTPEHKLRIVNAFKQRKEIVAMTGDGVNDALSLVGADLGVAMGRIGTEVAKEASDIVLLDDNFGSIISAVEEGRGIYKTIKKVILYLVSTSIGEAFTIGGALLLGFPIPILPVQIIWLNFVTDGFLDVALAMEPKEEGLLRGNFERPKKYLIDNLMTQRMFLMAIPMMIGALFLFNEYWRVDMAKALTVSLTILAAFQWLNAWNCRHESKSIFQMNPFSNKFLLAATIAIIFLQIFAVYNPVMQTLLHTAPLAFYDWFVIMAIAASIVFVEEVRKFIYRRKAKLPAEG